MKTTFTIITLLLLPLPAVAAAEPASPRPNIVFVLADDLGYGDLGCYNAKSKIPTPNLDRMASEGLRFTDAHASAAVCTPTRYGILTGRYCFRSRLPRGVLSPWDPPLIEKGRLTLPQLLQQSGYATAAIGKWHLGWDWPTTDGRPPHSKSGRANVDFTRPIAGGPTTLGFESYFGVDLPNYPPYCFIDNDHTVGVPSLVAPMTKGGMNRPGPMVPGWKLTAILPELTRRAVKYIEERPTAAPQKPFFLYFALTAPHYPVVPTAEFKGRSKAGDYGDFVAEVDDTAGKILAALARSGQASNTLVIFTSDNGPECVEVDPGAYERIRLYDHRSMDGLRGVKRDAWEGGHRVPFLARWPGNIPAGNTSGETVCTVDMMATCADLAGGKLPANSAEDSYDILPALRGKTLDRPVREATVVTAGNGKLAIRQGKWVFINAPTGDGNGKRGEPKWFKEQGGYVAHDLPGELYDLTSDLPERRNLYQERPEVVKRLKALLEKYKADGRSTPGAAQADAAGRSNGAATRIETLDE